MQPNRIERTSFFEVRPGFDAIRYLTSFGLLTLLARRARKRPATMFVEVSSTVDRHILSEGLFEKGVIETLRYVLSRSGTTELMIDIGANIGNHSIALAPLFRRVEAVEPHPILYRVLEANVLRNRMSHLSCHNFGLGKTEGIVTLEESPDEHSISRVAERSVLPPETFGLSGEQFGNRYSIQLKSAHDFVAQYADQLSRAFIKIDVEGMEQEIIESLEPLLRQYRPLVGFELFTKAQPNLVNIARAIPGYELHAIRMHDTGRSKIWRSLKLLLKGRKNTLEPVDPDRLDEVYPLVLMVPVPFQAKNQQS
ncbi:FkbM family methyltransferase [Bradyrhizobium sp. 2TAF36]|uniref:FkbM family methyltransferase n=1 Tax=Bradyrhizobium sp. 2TAF36 TaxID=3233016 RepID=UPI003F902C03